MNRAPMTAQGAQRLREELERLKSVERPKIIGEVATARRERTHEHSWRGEAVHPQAIAEARAHGDLKENAEYHAAREMQGFIEGRIKELEAALSYADVIDISRLNPGSRIVFGATVELADEDSGESITYQIVGDLEADIKRKLISVSSPLARALIGKSEGDSFDFQAPNGKRSYEIVAVRYAV